MTKKVL
jgi:hypothetical protein